MGSQLASVHTSAHPGPCEGPLPALKFFPELSQMLPEVAPTLGAQLCSLGPPEPQSAPSAGWQTCEGRDRLPQSLFPAAQVLEPLGPQRKPLSAQRCSREMPGGLGQVSPRGALASGVFQGPDPRSRHSCPWGPLPCP